MVPLPLRAAAVSVVSGKPVVLCFGSSANDGKGDDDINCVLAAEHALSSALGSI